MTAVGKRIVEAFEHLADGEKKEVLADLLRMSRGLDDPAVSDDELLAAADEIFRGYDQRETE